MSARNFNTLGDFHGLHIEVRCTECDHRSVVCPIEIGKLFRMRQHPTGLTFVRKRMRCRKCGAQYPRLLPTEAPLSLDRWTPTDAQWRRMMRKARD